MATTWTTVTTSTDNWTNTASPIMITLVQGSPMGFLLLLTNPFTTTIDTRIYTWKTTPQTTDTWSS